MKIGAITIGQAPREDVTCDVLPFLGEGVILLAGRRTGTDYRREEIAQFQPEQGDYVLISKLQDELGRICGKIYSSKAAVLYRAIGRAGGAAHPVFLYRQVSGPL